MRAHAVHLGVVGVLLHRLVELVLGERELALVQVGAAQLRVGNRGVLRVGGVLWVRPAASGQSERECCARNAALQANVPGWVHWCSHGWTATPMTLLPSRTVVRSMTRPASCPQAASMSSPRVRRTVASTPALQQLVPEALDDRGGRAPVVRARERIEGDEVDLGRMPLQQPRERARLRRGVVDALEHHVLERDAAAVLLVEVVPARLQQLRDRMLAVDRHELVAQRVVRARAATRRARRWFPRRACRSAARGRRWRASRAGATGRSRSRPGRCAARAPRCGSSPAARPCP